MTVLPHSSFFFFYCSLVAFHVCIEVQTVPVCTEFWCVLKKARNVPQSQKCVWERGDPRTLVLPCAPGEQGQYRIVSLTSVCTRFWRWWSSNWCPLFPVISSASGWWIMTDNTPSAVKAGPLSSAEGFRIKIVPRCFECLERGGVSV